MSIFQSSFWFFVTFLYKLSFAIGCSFAKDFCPCLLLFICKGLLSFLVLSYPFCFFYMFTKDRGRCLPVYLQRTAVLICCFVYKGPHSLSSAIHLQRTMALVLCVFILKGPLPCLCYSFAKDHCSCLVLFICKGPSSLSKATHLQRTAVLVLCYSFAKDRGTYFVPLVCRENCCSCYPFVVPAR